MPLYVNFKSKYFYNVNRLLNTIFYTNTILYNTLYWSADQYSLFLFAILSYFRLKGPVSGYTSFIWQSKQPPYRLAEKLHWFASGSLY